MNNFVYHNPTKLVFGKGQIARLAKLIPAGKKIMITFGGGSVRRNGIYDQVVKALEGRDWVEFWGIEPNPSVETVREAIALGREHGSEFLLAVGGGSVIDGTKLIAAGLLYDGDPWEIVLKGQADKTVPLGTVLTMSATGSEMNNGSVISCHETKEKFPFNGDYPLFSILDPEALFSLPQKQIAYGSVSYTHLMEVEVKPNESDSTAVPEPAGRTSDSPRPATDRPAAPVAARPAAPLSEEPPLAAPAVRPDGEEELRPAEPVGEIQPLRRAVQADEAEE